MEVGNKGKLRELYNFMRAYLWQYDIEASPPSESFVNRLMLPGMKQLTLDFELGKEGKVSLEKKHNIWKKWTQVKVESSDPSLENKVKAGVRMYAAIKDYWVMGWKS